MPSRRQRVRRRAIWAAAILAACLLVLAWWVIPHPATLSLLAALPLAAFALWRPGWRRSPGTLVPSAHHSLAPPPSCPPLSSRANGFPSLSLRAILTPRPDIAWLDDEAFDTWSSEVSRHPKQWQVVASGSLDYVKGIVRAADVLQSGDPLIVPAPWLSPNAAASDALALFRHSNVPLVCIGDGQSLLGVVTPHDLLEALVGDIPSPGEDRWLVAGPDGTWRACGGTPLYHLEYELGLALAPQDSTSAATLAGHILSCTRDVPSPGDVLSLGAWMARIGDVQQGRILWVELSQAVPEPGLGDILDA